MEPSFTIGLIKKYKQNNKKRPDIFYVILVGNISMAQLMLREQFVFQNLKK